MTMKAIGKHPARSKRRRKLWTVVMAICAAHGIPLSLRREAADEIIGNLHGVPKDKMQGFAHRVARRFLASDLGMSEREIPESRLKSNAIAQYEYERRNRERWRGHDFPAKSWTGGFDYHSRQFAIENGVCPRCSALGEFSPDGGVCECGYSY